MTGREDQKRFATGSEVNQRRRKNGDLPLAIGVCRC